MVASQMESASSFFGVFSSPSFYIAFVFFRFCFLVALLVIQLSPSRLLQQLKSLELDSGGGSLLRKNAPSVHLTTDLSLKRREA